MKTFGKFKKKTFILKAPLFIMAIMGIFLLVSFVIPELTGTDTYILTAYAKSSYSVDDSHYDDTEQKIYDNADLFTDSEESQLQQYLVTTAKEIKLDLVIATIDYNRSKDTLLYASDFYDDNGFGYEFNCGSGVILLIDMDNREVAISTAGVCRIYLDSETDDMIDDIAPYLSDREYMEAAEYFISRVRELALQAANDSDYDEAFEAWYSSDHSSIAAQNDFYDEYIPQDDYYDDYSNQDTMFTVFKNPLVDIIIALVVAAVATAVMSSSSKTKVDVNEKTYMIGGQIILKKRQDTFTHTTTTRRKIQTDSGNHGGGGGGGGHGGGHVSSSGHSHGGSSGKF